MGIWLLLALVSLGFGSVAAAQEAEREFDFNIPAQPVHTALVEFAEQANLTLVFPDDVVRDKTANALYGRHTLQEGVDILLAWTGLIPRFSNQVVLSVSADERPTNNRIQEQSTMGSKRGNVLGRVAAAFAGAILGASAGASDSGVVKPRKHCRRRRTGPYWKR